jgi:hypothetical protein
MPSIRVHHRSSDSVDFERIAVFHDMEEMTQTLKVFEPFLYFLYRNTDDKEGPQQPCRSAASKSSGSPSLTVS